MPTNYLLGAAAAANTELEVRTDIRIAAKLCQSYEGPFANNQAYREVRERQEFDAMPGLYYFPRGLTEGTVNAKVLSSRKRKEKKDRIRRKIAFRRTNLICLG
ncbi:hypothetical protein M8J77_022029 [Diaphorina citri]|nr:hypothetical protein M8J77_022029 [Diaphorina citri]